MSSVTLEKINALCKRRGFVYQSADIYGGLNGVYDFGPMGAQMKRNIKQAWLENVTNGQHTVVQLDGSLLGSPAVWKASGHLDNFHDPMVDCLNCKKRFRADEMDLSKPCSSCGVTTWTEAREFNLMFKTNLGAMADQAAVAYLRPETAQSIFINFKNVISSTRLKIPFGIAQIGKAFRNEITPKQFLFRMREFEQMELEFFCRPETAEHHFEQWIQLRKDFYASIGLTQEKLRIRPHAADELAHYSKACVDVEYNFPFGWKELEGIANRSDFDLKQHSHHSGKDLTLFDDESKQAYTPYVVECSVGVDRLFLTLLFDAYHEDEPGQAGDVRTSLRLHPRIAPITAAIFPLTKKLSDNARRIYQELKEKGFRVAFDDAGSIGKRYRRHDEVGTPVCFTFDFESLEDGAMTVRDRDTLKQERVAIDRVEQYLRDVLAK